MASDLSSKHQDDMMSNIMELVTCSLCNKRELSSILKVLPCFYSACGDCLKIHLQGQITSQGETFKCPGCSKFHNMPVGGKDGFEDNFFSVNIKFLSGILSNNPPKCKACEMIGEDNPSATYCLLCQGHFCTTDGSKHRATPGHQVVAHTELCTERIIPKLLSTSSKRCEDFEIHEDPQPFKHYCVQCKTLSCGECLTYKHEGHQKMPLKQAGGKFRGELKDKLEIIQGKKDEKRNQLVDLQNNLTGMIRRKNNTAQKITAFGDRVKEIVEEVIKKELDNLEKEADEEEKILEKAIDQVSTDKQLLDVATVYMATFLDNSSPVNVLCKYELFEKHLVECEKSIEELKPMQNKTFPFEHVIEDDIYKNMQNLILGKTLQDAEVTESPFKGGVGLVLADLHCNEFVGITEKSIEIIGKKCREIDNEFVRDVEPHSLMASVIHDNLLYAIYQNTNELVTFDFTGKKTKLINIPKQENKSGTSEVQKQPEENLFFIAVNPVNSDLYISSTATYTVYKYTATEPEIKPVITTGLDIPFFFCVIPHKGISVSFPESHEIHMYDFNGTLLWKYGSKGSGDQQFENPFDIVADHLGNMYVADKDNKRLHYISSDGQLLRHIDLEIHPGILAMLNNRLFITGDPSYCDDIGEEEKNKNQNKTQVVVLKCNYV